MRHMENEICRESRVYMLRGFWNFDAVAVDYGYYLRLELAYNSESAIASDLDSSSFRQGRRPLQHQKSESKLRRDM